MKLRIPLKSGGKIVVPIRKSEYGKLLQFYSLETALFGQVGDAFPVFADRLNKLNLACRDIEGGCDAWEAACEVYEGRESADHIRILHNFRRRIRRAVVKK